jgi:hypothetical protein
LLAWYFVTCTACSIRSGVKISKKEQNFGVLGWGGGQGKERRADMVKSSPDVQDKAPGVGIFSKLGA